MEIGQRIAERMHCRRTGLGDHQPAQHGNIQQDFPDVQTDFRHFQRPADFTETTDRLQRQRIADHRRPLGKIAFYTMRQCIHCCVNSHCMRQALGIAGVKERSFGEQTGLGKAALRLPLGIGQNRILGHFATGACRNRHSQNRQRLCGIVSVIKFRSGHLIHRQH